MKPANFQVCGFKIVDFYLSFRKHVCKVSVITYLGCLVLFLNFLPAPFWSISQPQIKFYHQLITLNTRNAQCLFTYREHYWLKAQSNRLRCVCFNEVVLETKQDRDLQSPARVETS